MPPLLGFITRTQRNAIQWAAHADAVATFYPSLPTHLFTDPGGPVKVVLTDFWKDPAVVADVGFEFTGFRQLTGSCVGVSTGNAVFTLAAVQRKLSQLPTKAFLPWWPYDYGTCRLNEGDRGQGEGAIDSVMAQTIIQNGVLPYDQATGLPNFDRSDGLALTSSQEMTYSDGAASVNTQWASVAKKFPVGSAAVCSSTADIKAAILNGYPVLDGCDDYIGGGTLQGDVALGKYDGRGGHSTCYLGYWDHPVHGPIFLYSNQWQGNTYPQDSSGKGRCCVWSKESDAARLFSLGGGGGETVALSHLTYFPAQPQLIDFSQA
jgi:hypothetical protein